MAGVYPKKMLALSVAAASACLSTPNLAFAQNEAKFSVDEVIVTARRRDEMLQEVPMTVNVVTGEDVDKLNLRKVEDIKTLVPGLTLAEDTYAPSASMRGVKFDTQVSGFNPTVEFYLNDAPAVSTLAMQAMFDIGQVEVLRGPQGTLRGRASPSGSITLTTKTPNLHEFEGYVDLTATDMGGKNIRSALNVPIVDGLLAARVAGFYEKNEGAGIKSLTSGKQTEYKGDGFRTTFLLEPTDDLTFNLMFQKLEPTRLTLAQVESANIEDPTLPASPQFIRATDRKAIADDLNESKADFKRTNFEAGWEFGPAQLNYVGSYSEQIIKNITGQDNGGFFDARYPVEVRNFGQVFTTAARGQSHEMRVTSVDPILNESVDYVAGILYQTNKTDNRVRRQTAIFAAPAPASPGTYRRSSYTPIVTGGPAKEQSYFGNLTWHITDGTELSGGARYITYKSENAVVVGGRTVNASDNDWEDWVYTLSLRHNITSNMSVYGSYGTSWRPGVNAVGDFSVRQTEREKSFQNLDPETSESLEFGFKSTWLDNRLLFNATVYRQEFKNYPYRAGGGGVYYVNTDGSTNVATVSSFAFVAAVPVVVNGLEVETSFRATSNWDMGFLFSWSKGEIDNGEIACNVYGGRVPSIADIRNASGGDNLATCTSNDRSNIAPLWTSTLHSEYRYPVGSWQGYVRGLVSLYGPSENDPTYSLDDVDSYQIVNLYTGLKSGDGDWEFMLYGKNVFNTERVLSRDETPESVGYNVGATGLTGITTYREITMTSERELGVNVKYNF